MAFLSKSSDSHSKKGGVSQSTSLQNLPLQTKLRVGRPHDAFEQEADRVADRVVNSPSPKSLTSPASPVAGQISRYVQKQAQEDEQKTVQKQAKPEEDKEAVQKQTKPEEDKEAVQKQTKPEEDKDTVQKQAKPEEDKDTVQKQAKPEEDKDTVQKQAKPEEDKDTVQKQAKPEEDKDTVQKQAKPEEDKDTVQKQAKPEEDKDTVQKQAKPEEDKDTVQKQAKPEEDKDTVQKQAKPEEDKEAVQKQTKPEEEQPDQPKVGGELNDPEVEQRLMASKTGGEPLEPDVLQDMEQRFNTSLSHVRIHRDGTAIDLCNRLNAEAFTHGSHIYFNAGKYNPTSAEGKRLLAHELTHVVQQSDRIEREIIQRANGASSAAPSTSALQVSQGSYRGTSIDIQARELRIPKVSVPNFKRRSSTLFQAKRPFELRQGGRGTTHQITLWKQDVENAAQTQLNIKKREAQDRGGVNQQGQFFFRARGNENFFLFGDETTLLERFKIPIWDKEENARSFQVDHIVEDQLGGDDDSSNYELLDASANMSAGSKLAHQIRQRIQAALEALREENPGNSNIPRPSRVNYVRQNYKVVFEDCDFELSGISGEPEQFWSREDIKTRNLHTSKIRPLRGNELEELGRQGRVIIFASETGGEMLRLPPRKPFRNWLPRIDFIDWVANENSTPGQSAGTLTVSVFNAESGRRRARGLQTDPTYSNQSWNVLKVDGIYGGVVEQASVARGVRQSLRLPGMSPIELDEIRLDGNRGLVGHGRVLSTVPFLRDANIEILILGDEAQIRKTFDLGEISVPPPFALQDSTLTIFYSDLRGLGIEGRTGFEIQSVGQGFIAAAASTEGGFELEGEFNFDSQLFDPAKVNVTYRNNNWGVAGEIGIPRGKVRGIRSANITVAYTEGTFTANGRAELDIRGVESGTLSATYSAQGWSIGGTFNLSGDIPRIRSGSVSVTVQKVAGEEGYRLTATGTAVPDIPGITSQLTIGYDNGILTIEGQASYSRGLLSGEITVGATNRAVGADGQPTGDPTDRFILYGGGSLTIRITPWLQGTVGVRFQPNGEMIVSGRIGLPSSIEVFRRFGIPEREVFGIGFDIPIFAIPVGPRSIGLVASIRGGLRVYAGIGPGRLERLELGVEYNPAHPEETHVTGGGRFVIPAEAGLRLFVRATIGLSAVIGGVEGGLELAGGLGLEAAAEADVNVDWTPQTGLELNASLSAYVQPKFIFTIDGLIRAWFAFYEKEWRWRLANYEYGPDLRFGVRLPIHYREGEPFDISFDNLEITRPNIDASSFLGGLIRDIRERRG